MGNDYQLRKNYYFCLSFLCKSRTLWQTKFNKKYFPDIGNVFPKQIVHSG